MLKTVHLILLLVAAIQLPNYAVFAQTIMRPVALSARGVYMHTYTKKEFPKSFAEYKRKGIYAFDRSRANIGAIYKSPHSKTTISVYLYPAADGDEGRLRREYLSSLNEIAIVSKKGITSTKGYTFYKKDGYKVNGFRADIHYVKEDRRSFMAIYECGKWFFKLRITSDLLDSTAIDELRNSLLDRFNPAEIVKNDPLEIKAAVAFAPLASTDSLIATTTIGSALKKIKWAEENIDSLERAAGFPDLYLEQHVEALKEFIVQAEKEPMVRKKWKAQQHTIQYLAELRRIIDSGFLREFILDEYKMVMIVPDDIKLDFDSYRQWRLSNSVNFSLNDKLYVVSYNDGRSDSVSEDD
jgi:hypothetical protein